MKRTGGVLPGMQEASHLIRWEGCVMKTKVKTLLSCLLVTKRIRMCNKEWNEKTRVEWQSVVRVSVGGADVRL